MLLCSSEIFTFYSEFNLSERLYFCLICCFALMWRYYAKLHWSCAMISSIKFCTTDMYWVYISNVAYLGQVYAGRLTKIIVVWSDWTCMCVFLCLFVYNSMRNNRSSHFSHIYGFYFSVFSLLSGRMYLYMTALKRAKKKQNMSLYFQKSKFTRIFKLQKKKGSHPIQLFFVGCILLCEVLTVILLFELKLQLMWAKAAYRPCIRLSWSNGTALYLDKIFFMQTLQLLCSFCLIFLGSKSE